MFPFLASSITSFSLASIAFLSFACLGLQAPNSISRNTANKTLFMFLNQTLEKKNKKSYTKSQLINRLSRKPTFDIALKELSVYLNQFYFKNQIAVSRNAGTTLWSVCEIAGN